MWTLLFTTMRAMDIARVVIVEKPFVKMWKSYMIMFISFSLPVAFSFMEKAVCVLHHITFYGIVGSVPTLHLAAQLQANSSARQSEETSYRSASSASSTSSASKNRSVSYSQSGLIFNPTLNINTMGLMHPKRSSSFPISSGYSNRIDDCTIKSPRAIERELDSITSSKHMYHQSSIIAKPLSSCRHKIAGIILHSAVLSGGRTLFNSDLFRCCDPFDNSKTAKEVKVTLHFCCDDRVVSCISYSWNERRDRSVCEWAETL